MRTELNLLAMVDESHSLEITIQQVLFYYNGKNILETLLGFSEKRKGTISV